MSNYFGYISTADKWTMLLARLFGRRFAQTTEDGTLVYYKWRGAIYIQSFSE
jgi:hypothetical protein